MSPLTQGLRYRAACDILLDTILTSPVMAEVVATGYWHFSMADEDIYF